MRAGLAVAALALSFATLTQAQSPEPSSCRSRQDVWNEAVAAKARGDAPFASIESRSDDGGLRVGAPEREPGKKFIGKVPGDDDREQVQPAAQRRSSGLAGLGSALPPAESRSQPAMQATPAQLAQARQLAAAVVAISIKPTARGVEWNFCNGIQISPGYILTARHCVPSGAALQVHYGDLLDLTNGLNAEEKSIVRHLPGRTFPSGDTKLKFLGEQRCDATAVALAAPLYDVALLKVAAPHTIEQRFRTSIPLGSSPDGSNAALLEAWIDSNLGENANCRQFSKCLVSKPEKPIEWRPAPPQESASRCPQCYSETGIPHWFDTQDMSSGAPVLDLAGKHVIAIHRGGEGGDLGDPETTKNYAVPVQWVREQLRAAGVWP